MIISPDAVFNFTTLTTSFEPYVSKTLIIGQSDRSISFIITIIRSSNLELHDLEFRFCQIVKMGKYSRTHFLQNISVEAWSDLHFHLKLIWCSLKFIGFWLGDALLMRLRGVRVKLISLCKGMYPVPLPRWGLLHSPGENIKFSKIFRDEF